jgi:methylmalonyl-CoA mutase cobalamin-binding subunit
VHALRLLGDAERLDAAAVRSRLDEAAATLGLAGCVDDVLLPAMRQVGVWWAVGHCDVAQERMATEAVRAWMDRRVAFAPAPSHPRPVILACGPSDLHTIGLESMAVLLRYAGWPVRVLGARTSTITVATAAQATGAAAVVVVSHLATGRSRAVESIRAIDQLDIPVFYAGNAFSAPRTRRGVPGSYLGVRIQDACAQVVDALTPNGADQDGISSAA